MWAHYYAISKFIERVNQNISWTVWETPMMAREGVTNFQNKQLKFISELNDLSCEHVDLVLASGVLQCVDDPIKYYKKIKSLKPRYILLDKIPFIEDEIDRLTIQKVSPFIYRASYPSWFFSKKKWYVEFIKDYEELARWRRNDYVILDKKEIYFQGLLLRNTSFNDNS